MMFRESGPSKYDLAVVAQDAYGKETRSGNTMKKRRVDASDLVQKNYWYYRTEPIDKNSHPELTSKTLEGVVEEIQQHFLE